MMDDKDTFRKYEIFNRMNYLWKGNKIVLVGRWPDGSMIITQKNFTELNMKQVEILTSIPEEEKYYV